MKRILTVARREVASFFDHPTAYILVVAFLGLGLFLTFRTIYASGMATLRPFFDLLPWLFAIFIPAMTMRSLAEERRSGTLEWLLSHPLREVEVVLGKFIGNWFFVLVALMGTIPAAFGLLKVSEADGGIMVAEYIGAGLLAAQGVAIGLWASSLTQNQITSFILSASASFLLVMIGTPVVLIGLPPWLGVSVSNLSVLGHFDNVARGVVDLRDVIYFLSTAAVFLFMAVGVMSRERLSAGRSAYRRLRTGTAALIAVVVVLNLLGGNIRGRLDLTRGSLYTLSDGTREILGGLDDIVTLRLVISDELPAELQPTLRDVADLVADLRGAADGQLVVENLNPNDDQESALEARNLGITQNEFNVLRDDAFEVRRGWFGLALLYADQREVIPFINRTDDLELRLLTAIVKMTAEGRPGLAFLTGFGSQGPATFPSFSRAVSERYDVQTIDLEADTAPALNRDSIEIVVVAGPQQPIRGPALEAIQSFMGAGGSALLLIDKHQVSPDSPMMYPVVTGLEEFLQARGVETDAGVVLDHRSNSIISMGPQGFSNVVRRYPLWPVAVRGDEHATTRDLNNLSPAWATALTVTDSTVRKLWVTSEAGAIQAAGGIIMPDALLNPDPDDFQTVTLAVALDPAAAGNGESSADGDGSATEGRMIVVGDVDFLQEQFLRANPENLVFTLNSIDWLAQDEALIGIRSKLRTPPAMAFTSDFQRGALKWGNLVGVPLLFVAVGITRVAGRRRRIEARWKEAVS
jgi:ABC-2 type transport system permease protein